MASGVFQSLEEFAAAGGAGALIVLMGIYCVFSAFLSWMGVILLTRGWGFGRSLSICLSAWSKVFAGFLFLYGVQILDRQNGDLSPLDFAVATVAGAMLIIPNLEKAGDSPRHRHPRPGVAAGVR
jgi:hypothetical protein